MSPAPAKRASFTLAEADRKALINLLGKCEATDAFIRAAERDIARHRLVNQLSRDDPTPKEIHEQIGRIKAAAEVLSRELSAVPDVTASQIRQGAYLSARCRGIPDLLEIEDQLKDLSLAAGEIMKDTKPSKGRRADGAAMDLIRALAASFSSYFSWKPSASETSYFLRSMEIILLAAGIEKGIPDKVKKALKKMGGKLVKK